VEPLKVLELVQAEQVLEQQAQVVDQAQAVLA